MANPKEPYKREDDAGVRISQRRPNLVSISGRVPPLGSKQTDLVHGFHLHHSGHIEREICNLMVLLLVSAVLHFYKSTRNRWRFLIVTQFLLLVRAAEAASKAPVRCAAAPDVRKGVVLLQLSVGNFSLLFGRENEEETLLKTVENGLRG